MTLWVKALHGKSQFCHEPLKVSHHPARFGGYRHYGSRDMFLVVEEQDFKSWLKSVVTIYLESACHAHIHEIYNNQNTNEIIKRVQ